MMKKLLLFIAFIAIASLLEAQSEGDFQSRETGDWASSDTWEEYVTGSWTNNTNVPVGSDVITIIASHTVTLDSPTFTVTGSLTIEAGADLEITGSLANTGGTILIQSDATGTGELISGGTPPATVQRYIYATDNSYWHQIGIPVGGATANDIYQNNSPNVWMQKWNAYEDPVQTWQFITDETETLNQLVGYMVTGDDSFPIEWNGTIKTDDVFQTLPADFLPDSAYLLFGNPYTSSVEVFAAGDSLGANFVNSIWVWDPSTTQYTSYQMGTGGTNPGIVAAGQSMFVQIIDSTVLSSFSLDADKRVFSNTDNFLKSGNLLNWDDDYGIGVYAMFKVVDGISKDAAFVNFGEDGTDGFENGYDGNKKFGSKTVPQMYFVQNEMNLSTNYIETLKEAEERIVNLNFKAGVTGEHILAANLNSLPNTQVTLEDLQTGAMHEFNLAEQYVFNAAAEDNPARFLVHFLTSPTGIEDPQGDNSTGISVYAYNKAIYISNTNGNNIQSDIKVYDLIGREIYSTKTELTGSTRIPVSVSNTYLVVKVIQENKITTEKVFIK